MLRVYEITYCLKGLTVWETALFKDLDCLETFANSILINGGKVLPDRIQKVVW
jgi:hypothetical protein